MDSRKPNKAALYQKLQQLRAATNSTSINKASIVVDATKYIQELKERVERLNQDVASLQSCSSHQGSSPAVKVETLERGFLINVYSEKNCPGLLVSILEAFEELGLEILDARVSCSDNFHLEAVSDQNEDGESENLDEQVVRQAVLQAIRNWSDQNQDV